MLKIIKSGFFSSIQDEGRYGYQKYGVIVSGVMDTTAYRIGNALLKQRNKPAIEMTLIGGTFQFTKQTTFILTGGLMEATINELPIAMYKAIHVQAGDILACGPIQKGARSYLCILGGFLVDEVLGSHSTYLKAQFGGFGGRTLKLGDEIPYTEVSGQSVSYSYSPNHFYADTPIRILQGTEWGHFSERTQQQFLKQNYTISLEADRMGYRLECETPITLQEPFQLLSEAVTFGTIQLPPNGQPIILMADRQTTGGYPKIAQVITADLHRLAQLRPMQILQFECVTMDQAEDAYIKHEQQLRLLEIILSN